MNQLSNSSSNGISTGNSQIPMQFVGMPQNNNQQSAQQSGIPATGNYSDVLSKLQMLQQIVSAQQTLQSTQVNQIQDVQNQQVLKQQTEVAKLIQQPQEQNGTQQKRMSVMNDQLQQTYVDVNNSNTLGLNNNSLQTSLNSNQILQQLIQNQQTPSTQFAQIQPSQLPIGTGTSQQIYPNTGNGLDLMQNQFLNPLMFGMLPNQVALAQNPYAQAQWLQYMSGLPSLPIGAPLQGMMGGGLGVGFNQCNMNQFHTPGPKNEVKFFVGGLQFQTQEGDLNQYFGQFGQVADSIIMRDKSTGRGRGFGFVRMVFQDEEEASKIKDQVIEQNQTDGHFILDKKVDVKSADDYQGKNQGFQQNGQQQNNNNQMGNQGNTGQNNTMNNQIQKPNPYVITETKVLNDQTTEFTFKYPNSKIFVGGLDFKLTVEELKQHFSQFGEVQDAIILKDIYTGQSRGFGFVTFKDEDIAQNLISGVQVTTINGRKVDIKKSEPKMGGTPYIPQKGGNQQMGGYNYGQNQPTMIPPYQAHQSQGSSGQQQNRHRKNDDNSSRSNSNENKQKNKSRGGKRHEDNHKRRDSNSPNNNYRQRSHSGNNRGNNDNKNDRRKQGKSGNSNGKSTSNRQHRDDSRDRGKKYNNQNGSKRDKSRSRSQQRYNRNK